MQQEQQSITDRLRSKIKSANRPTVNHSNDINNMVPPAPQPHFDFATQNQGQSQTVGQLMERVATIEKKLDTLYRLVFRTSAIGIGLIAPVAGFDWIGKLIKALGF